MKITHRVPTFTPKPVILDADYQAEVDRCTLRAERAYAKALRDMARAKAKLHTITAARDKKQIKLAAALVELRRQQLEALEAQMRAAPASATHRGRSSYRPVPPTQGSQM